MKPDARLTISAPTGLAGRLPGRLSEQVAVALQDAVAPNTRKTYASAWQRFTAWADAEGLPALPAAPATVAGYLAALMGAGRTLATARLHRAAILKAHDLVGHPRPDGPEIRTLLRGLDRRHGKPQNQASGLTRAGLAAIRATAHQPRPGRGGSLESTEKARQRGDLDIALASVMRDGLLRISEAAELTWADIQRTGKGDGRARIYRAKTAKRADERQLVYLGAPTMAALARIQPSPLDPEAPVFGLRPNQLAVRLKQAARSAGLEGNYSGHSPRVGMAQDLSANGAELPAIMQAGGWKTSRMVARYTERQTLERGAVASYYDRPSG